MEENRRIINAGYYETIKSFWIICCFINNNSGYGLHNGKSKVIFVIDFIKEEK